MPSVHTIKSLSLCLFLLLSLSPPFLPLMVSDNSLALAHFLLSSFTA